MARPRCEEGSDCRDDGVDFGGGGGVAAAVLAGTVHQPRAVLAGVQSARAGGGGEPPSSAARKASVPVDLGQQSRRILHGPGGGARGSGPVGRHGSFRRRSNPGRATRAHQRAGRVPGRIAAGTVARPALRTDVERNRHSRRRGSDAAGAGLAAGVLPSARLSDSHAPRRRSCASLSVHPQSWIHPGARTAQSAGRPNDERARAHSRQRRALRAAAGRPARRDRALRHPRPPDRRVHRPALPRL